MKPPTPTRLFQTLDETWPAARKHRFGPWMIREGEGGGQRVSAATAVEPTSEDSVAKAERAMRDLGQYPLFMIRHEDAPLDSILARRRYSVVDPVTIYLGAAPDLATDVPASKALQSWPPLAVQCEIWEAAGIGAARQNIMARCDVPKVAILGRTGDAPAGTAFVAVDKAIAMVHAIEVTPVSRRRGVGRTLLHSCAAWCLEQGADWLSLAVTRSNAGANALYRSLGMSEVARYHYRRAPEEHV